MQIKFFCPKWGSDNISWDDFCKKVKNAGFDGVETPIPPDAPTRLEIAAALKKYELLFIAQFYQSFEKDFDLHKQHYRQDLESLAAMQPLFIDSQTGKDYFSPAQNGELFKVAQQVTNETGVLIAHETHRNKALFAAHVSKALLEENPDVVITADFSHWCVVSESLLEQQEEAMQLAISRAAHIHARVGHIQSAQVSDPRAPEWKAEMNAHLQWWDAIVQNRSKQGVVVQTITPEFGPIPYMPAHPYTNTPLASQWDINVYMLHLLKERYKAVG
jgi:sugar phosphate isomerase/epimerase